MIRNLEHGSVWLANLQKKQGTESGKIRPVLILQNQALLDAGHPSTIIIPLTTNLIDDAAPLRLRISATGDLEHDSDLMIDQVRAIDNQRLMKGPLLHVDKVFLKKIYQAVQEVLGIDGGTP
jgi:mRNA interferase MazF